METRTAGSLCSGMEYTFTSSRKYHMNVGFARLLSSLALVLTLPLLFAGALPVPEPSPAVHKLFDSACEDLLSADEGTANRALLKFVTRPDEAIEFLKERLPPLRLTRDRARELLTDLGSDDVRKVRAAYTTFTYLDPRLALKKDELDKALKQRPLSQRLAEVVCDLPLGHVTEANWIPYCPNPTWYCFQDFIQTEARNWFVPVTVADINRPGPEGMPWTELAKQRRKSSWVRAVRAIAILEHIGTPRAKAVLTELATGHPDAIPTQAAKSACDRLKSGRK